MKKGDDSSVVADTNQFFLYGVFCRGSVLTVKLSDTVSNNAVKLTL